MKVIYYVGYPLAWAKGGHAIQVYETIRAVEQLGVEVAWLHPEDREPATGDILHYFARPPSDFHWQLARQRGMKIVVSELHQLGVLRPRWAWHIRGKLAKILPRVIGQGMYGTMGVEVYRHVDAALAVTRAEADYMRIVMGSPADRTHYVPNGVDDVFFDPAVPPEPFDGLLYLSYICERKNSLEVARLAKRANVPVKFIGSPVVAENAYADEFAREVDNRLVFWEKEITDRRRIAAMLRGAPGSFLASQNEGLPLTMLESLAAGTPVMAPDLPNLREFFGSAASYIPDPRTPAATQALQTFYRQCKEGLKPSFVPHRWSEVGRQVCSIYKEITS